jgi:allophanate hydrolase subunit 1
MDFMDILSDTRWIVMAFGAFFSVGFTYLLYR